MLAEPAASASVCGTQMYYDRGHAGPPPHVMNSSPELFGHCWREDGTTSLSSVLRAQPNNQETFHDPRGDASRFHWLWSQSTEVRVARGRAARAQHCREF